MSWVYIFNALLKYAETRSLDTCKRIRSLEDIISKVYRNPLKDQVIKSLSIIKEQTVHQLDNKDHIGTVIDNEDELFSKVDL